MERSHLPVFFSSCGLLSKMQKSVWFFGKFKRLYSTAARCAIIFAPLTPAPWREAKKTVRGFFRWIRKDYTPHAGPMEKGNSTAQAATRDYLSEEYPTHQLI